MIVDFILISMVVFLGYNVYKLNGRIEKNKEFEDVGIILPKLKERIEIKDVDKGYQLLKDVIESAKIENWECEIIRSLSDRYEIKVTSNKKDLMFATSLLIFDSGGYSVGNFQLKNLENGVMTGSVSYDIDKKYEIYGIVVKYIWDKISEKRDSDNESHRIHYQGMIDKFNSKLTTLNRERKLNKLFGG